MSSCKRCFGIVAIVLLAAALVLAPVRQGEGILPSVHGAVSVKKATVHDESLPLNSLRSESECVAVETTFESYDSASQQAEQKNPLTAAAVEQTRHGTKPPPEIVASFDGLGVGFEGPQGKFAGGNPSDNSLAVGPDHIVQTVNTKMAIFTKKGRKFSETGKVLYGPVNIGNVFKGFFDKLGEINNGDSVVRYDQLADRWLVCMPVFRKLPFKIDAIAGKSGGPVQFSLIGIDGQPGQAQLLYQPKAGEKGGGGGGGGAGGKKGGGGSYAMCYAVSTSSDPLGSYFRYCFERPLFPDYPRPAIWPDGYYNPTSTSDNIIQRHAYVAEREKMLRGLPANEQGFIIDDVVFLLNADLDGQQLPPPGAPNIMMTTGGAQLRKILKDDGIYWWKFYVDWQDSSKTKLEGPTKITVAPYEYLGGGQLTRAIPQPDTTNKLDAQGEKLMARLVYRRIGDREIIVGAQCNTTAAGGGGIRWYEFRLDKKGEPVLHQQGTYCPDEVYRWMPSPAIDAKGNIGIGYSYSDSKHYPGQRFAGRHADDPLGVLTLKEAVLIEGEASQQGKQNRWQDYTQTAVDPVDDMTIWYVGDYYKKGATSYSTRIGGFRLEK